MAEAVLALGVSLEDQIGLHVSGLNECYSNRLIADLLNHTSGLDDYGDMPEYQMAVKEEKSAWSRNQLLELAAKRAHNNVGFRYSNIGYLLLVMLIEKETQSSYFEAIAKLVFNPLNIKDFQPWTERHPSIPNYDPNWVYSGTFLGDPKTIAHSLMILARHRHHSIGLQTGIAQLTYLDTGFKEPGYGFGFMSDGGWNKSEPRYVGHGGGGPGFNLMALVNTANWKYDLEYSIGDFDQSKAITSLINKIQ